MEEIETGYQTLGNKSVFPYLLLITFLGCQSAPKNEPIHEKTIALSDTDSISVSVSSNLDKEKKDLIQVQPDTTINRKLILENSHSAKEFFSNVSTTSLVEKIRSSPVLVFTNTSGSEYLLAYQYEGNTANSFSSFEIGKVKDLENIEKKSINRSQEQSFKTESGLSLGLSLEELINIKGNQFSRFDKDSTTVLTYRIGSSAKNAFLKRYQMPGYFIEITLLENKVVKIYFGFEYP